MAATVEKYNHLTQRLLDGTLDLDAGDLKVMLVTSAYTFSAAHTVLANISGEVTGAGYTAGGKTMTGSTVTTATGVAKWDADDVVWTAATITARRAIVYRSGTFSGLVNPLLFSILLDNTPADVASSGNDFAIIWDAAGIATL